MEFGQGGFESADGNPAFSLEYNSNRCLINIDFPACYFWLFLLMFFLCFYFQTTLQSQFFFSKSPSIFSDSVSVDVRTSEAWLWCSSHLDGGFRQIQRRCQFASPRPGHVVLPVKLLLQACDLLPCERSPVPTNLVGCVGQRALPRHSLTGVRARVSSVTRRISIPALKEMQKIRIISMSRHVQMEQMTFVLILE